MSWSDKSLVILTPMRDGLATNNHVTSLMHLAGLLFGDGIEFSRVVVTNEAMISKARNRLADSFMKNSSASHALFIDADFGFNAADVLRMLRLDRDIVGVPCPKKSIQPEYIFNVERETILDMDKPCEVKNLGMGLMMVKRRVFEKLEASFPDRWYDASNDPDSLPGPVHDFFRVGINPETRQYDSEDYWFCADAKEVGFKVWMLPWAKTSHMGAFKYVGDLPAVAQLAG